MPGYEYLRTKHCRWCGIEYCATKPVGKDGFHSKACKQAHYRAYKKYVTAKMSSPGFAADRKVTHRKAKKQ